MAVMKDKRHYLSACTINDEFIYAFGGFFGSTEQEINDTIEVYDVDKNTWVVLTVRMKVSLSLRVKILHSSDFAFSLIEPSLGLLGLSRLTY